jgi:hypothetical protein
MSGAVDEIRMEKGCSEVLKGNLEDLFECS